MTSPAAGELAEKLSQQHSLTESEYKQLIDSRTPELAARLAELASDERRRVYGNAVYTRGLIEISNVCKNDCYYCGIRKSNAACDRFRLTQKQIVDAAGAGYGLGFRTFVMQGGEDGHFTDDVLCPIIEELKDRHPDCAVTLSLGERSFESYERLRRAGADRYLLRHEAADEELYGRLHPGSMSHANRMRCLEDLRGLGYQVGCGFMVGAPFQTSAHVAEDLKFIEEFRPDMCGIGPFLPQKDTPFAGMTAGTAELTCFLLSVIRLIHPPVLLPATTALETAAENGWERGILAGANVIMPNLSPPETRAKYALYDNKAVTGIDSLNKKKELQERMRAIGCELVDSRGDVLKI